MAEDGLHLFLPAHDYHSLPLLLVCFFVNLSSVCLSLPLFCPSLFSPFFSSPTGFHCVALAAGTLCFISMSCSLVKQRADQPANLLPPAASRTLRSLAHSCPFPHSRCDFICMMSTQLSRWCSQGSMLRIERCNKPFRVTHIITYPGSIVVLIFSEGSSKQFFFSITLSRLQFLFQL